MINEQARVFGSSKVDIYHEKTEAYLKGEQITPVKLEMD